MRRRPTGPELVVRDSGVRVYNYFPVCEGEIIGQGAYAQRCREDGVAVHADTTPELQPAILPQAEFDKLFARLEVESNCRHPFSERGQRLTGLLERLFPNLRVGLTFRVACSKGLPRLRENMASQCRAYFGGASFGELDNACFSSPTDHEQAGASAKGFSVSFSLPPTYEEDGRRLVHRIVQGQMQHFSCVVESIDVAKSYHFASNINVASLTS